jgi:hypothetical protein
VENLKVWQFMTALLELYGATNSLEFKCSRVLVAHQLIANNLVLGVCNFIL